MKKSIYTALLFLSCLLNAQNRDDLKLRIETEKSEFEKVQSRYFDLVINSETLLFKDKKDGRYSYYSKAKYDSLTRNQSNDSMIVKNSILKIPVGKNEYYIMKTGNLKTENYEFYKYKEDKLVSIERSNSISQLYSKDNFVELTKDSFCGSSQCLYPYTSVKYAQLDAGKQFSNVLYSMQVSQQDMVSEHFYDKDFPLDQKTLLKIFISKFRKQALPLMKQIKYIRQHGSAYKTFDSKDAAYEADLLQPKIMARYRAESEIDDVKNSNFNLNIRREVELRKEYDSSDHPYYKLSVSIDMKSWKFKINSASGDLEEIEYFLLYE